MKPKKPMEETSKKALAYSKFYGGKIGTGPKVPVHSLQDFSIWYTPGVGAVCMAIHANPELVYEYTNKWNTVAVITDGTRVLGLGNIGPEASLPVMEGKALIYKFLGGVDAHPVPISAHDPEQFINVVKTLEPSLGGINLEDIESPKCFEILDRLRAEMNIPVWHDDQQGTAGVTLAGLFNALKVTERPLKGSRIVMFGSGAANIATVRLLIAAGCDPHDVIMIDTKGILYPEREDIDQLLLRNKWKYEMALKTNGDRIKGGLDDALKGADVLIAAAGVGPDLIKKNQIALMNKRAITFLLANPVPEMWPKDAIAAGAEVVATGRSDFPNQVNNSLLFPAIFRGALDVRAKTISDTMVIVAATELAAFAEGSLSPQHIIPTMDDWKVYGRVAAAVGYKAQQEGLARTHMSRSELLRTASERIEHSRRSMKVLMEKGIILEPPA